jgi:hypothetical protein
MSYLLYFILLLPKNDTCKTRYLHELLKMPVQKEYLMVVKAKYKSKDVDIVLTNLELIQNLRRKDIEVNNCIAEKIKGNRVILTIDDSTKFVGAVKYYKAVTAIQAKGKSYFVDYFFDKAGYLKSVVKGEYTGQIIKILFNWNLFVSEDDLGVLHLSKMKVCN